MRSHHMPLTAAIATSPVAVFFHRMSLTTTAASSRPMTISRVPWRIDSKELANHIAGRVTAELGRRSAETVGV
jgi:hypothetical protein